MLNFVPDFIMSSDHPLEAMLWSLLVIWVSQRQPRYSSMNSIQRVPYISDIGKPEGFDGGNTKTKSNDSRRSKHSQAIFYCWLCNNSSVFLGIFTLRPYVREISSTQCRNPRLIRFPIGHNHALIGRVEQLYDRISVVSGITGSAGLVALAVFDTARHHDLHFFCLLVFMGGII